MTDGAIRDPKLLDALVTLAVEAGRAILDVYETGGVEIRSKSDLSPVTDADERAEAILISGLAALLPGVAVVAEEASARDGAPRQVPDTFILVDPLDGTREFLARNGEFTVNVGLVRAGAPVIGCVHAPALGTSWIGAVGEGARVARSDLRRRPEPGDFRPIETRGVPSRALRAVASRSHVDAETEAFLAGLEVADRRSAGSSLKFCLVAEGEADVYPRFGPTMEWDTAAGHGVLAAAGGSVTRPDGSPFVYGKTEAGFKNGAFVAWGRRDG